MLPTLIDSESRRVGYANPWVRPPPEIYTLLPITHNDGVDISYRVNAQDLTNTVQGVFGWNVEHSPPAIAEMGAATICGASPIRPSIATSRCIWPMRRCT